MASLRFCDVRRGARFGSPGDFMTVWQSSPKSAATDPEILAVQFDSECPLSAPIQVNTNIAGPQIRPAVAMDNDGTFLTVWATNPTPDTDPDDFDIKGIDIDIDIDIEQTAIFCDGFESGDTAAWSATTP